MLVQLRLCGWKCWLLIRNTLQVPEQLKVITEKLILTIYQFANLTAMKLHIRESPLSPHPFWWPTFAEDSFIWIQNMPIKMRPWTGNTIHQIRQQCQSVMHSENTANLPSRNANVSHYTRNITNKRSLSVLSNQAKNAGHNSCFRLDLSWSYKQRIPPPKKWNTLKFWCLWTFLPNIWMLSYKQWLRTGQTNT
jgi:hypothetical protein